MVDEEFEAEVAPEGEEFDVDANFAEAGAGVVAEAGVVDSEVAEAEAIEMPAMGGVAPGAEVGIVRRFEDDLAAGLQNAVEFFHGGDDVADVFNDVDEAGLVERARFDGPGELIEIPDDVGGGIGVAIDAGAAGVFLDSAAHI